MSSKTTLQNYRSYEGPCYVLPGPIHIIVAKFQTDRLLIDGNENRAEKIQISRRVNHIRSPLQRSVCYAGTAASKMSP